MYVLALLSMQQFGIIDHSLVFKMCDYFIEYCHRCTHIKLRDGSVIKLTGDLRRSIERKISKLAARPLRCLALAVKETQHLERTLKQYSSNGDIAARSHPLLSDQSKYIDIESGLTLVGKLLSYYVHLLWVIHFKGRFLSVLVFILN